MEYTNINQIPLILRDYLQTISGTKDLKTIPLKDINDFLKMVNSYGK